MCHGTFAKENSHSREESAKRYFLIGKPTKGKEPTPP